MEAIKPRQIINYGTVIVLIDLLKQRKSNFRQCKSATLNTGNLRAFINEEQNPQNNNNNIRFPNQMIEQINIALEQKGSGISQPGSTEACRRRLASERGIYINSVMKRQTSFFLRQDDIVNSLNYEGIAVIELQFYHFPDGDRLRVGSVTD